MKKVGQVLADERHRRRISLEEVSKITKIKVRFLEAMEQNDFSALPPSAFVRGFLKTYAEELGLDSVTILALFRRDFKINDRGEIIPREFLKPEYRKRSVLTPRLTTALTIVGVIGIVLTYAGWQWYQLQQPPFLNVAQPTDFAIVQKQVVIEGKTESDAVVFVNSNPVAISVDGTFTTQVFFDELGDHTITVRAEDRKKRATSVQRTVTVRE